MTPAQIDEVKRSFVLIVPIADQAGISFYTRLFEIDPSLRSLFKSDIEAQSKKLMQMIAIAVNGLDRLETIVPAVQALGARHAAYGVADAHYDTVGSALLWTLEQGLGSAFTPKAREAWTAAYLLLADTMKAAAREPSSRPKSTAPNGSSCHSRSSARRRHRQLRSRGSVHLSAAGCTRAADL
jgi:nitric oxide dioxygenase